ncbi:MAG TPA: hypothetical protein VGM80_13195 [Gaiellaceae bacterium]
MSGARPAGNADFRGTWHVSSSCCDFTITSQSASGGCSGTVGAAGFTITGCSVSGDHFSFTTVQTSTSYRSANSGTITGNSLDAQFKDSNGNEVPYTATRAGAPSGNASTGSPAGDEQTVCLGGCSDLEVKYDSMLAPGDTTVTVGGGCDGGSAPRVTTAAHTSADGPSCNLSDMMQMSPGELDALGANKLDAATMSQIQKDAQAAQTKQSEAAKDLQGKINDVIQDIMTNKSTTLDKNFQETDAYLRGYVSPADAPALANIDQSLAPDFPTETLNGVRELASVSAVHEADPNLVLASIVSSHPTASDRAAFKTAVGLATAPVYSPARGRARLTLALTFEIGRLVLISDLGLKLHGLRSAPAITLGSAHANIPAKGSRKMTIVTSTLGGRVLRLLEILGLGNHVTTQLALTSKVGAKTSKVTRQIRIT